jgi:hypothetical protein
VQVPPAADRADSNTMISRFNQRGRNAVLAIRSHNVTSRQTVDLESR